MGRLFFGSAALQGYCPDPMPHGAALPYLLVHDPLSGLWAEARAIQRQEGPP